MVGGMWLAAQINKSAMYLWMLEFGKALKQTYFCIEIKLRREKRTQDYGFTSTLLKSFIGVINNI